VPRSATHTCEGTSSWLTVMTRTQSGFARENSRIAAAGGDVVGPPPTKSALKGAAMPASAAISVPMPFPGTNRPMNPTTGTVSFPPNRCRIAFRASGSGLKMNAGT
jgi:hypothetical protein